MGTLRGVDPFEKMRDLELYCKDISSPTSAQFMILFRLSLNGGIINNYHGGPMQLVGVEQMMISTVFSYVGVGEPMASFCEGSGELEAGAGLCQRQCGIANPA